VLRAAENVPARTKDEAEDDGTEDSLGMLARLAPTSPNNLHFSSNLVPILVFSKLAIMSAELEPDAALMMRVKAGDGAAFAELVDKYKQPVINLAYRMLRDVAEAEDVAQNVFLQVHKSAHRYEVSSKFSTWLFTIARNLSLNEIRRRTRHPADPLDAPHPENEDQPLRQHEDHKTFLPTQSLLHGELEQKIEEALADLPENQRTAIILCRQDDLSYEDIGRVLGCSLSATKSLIHRGRETLKQRLKPYLRSGFWHQKGQTDEPVDDSSLRPKFTT
jgi:RNA polymerase sigma-70 factor, ECF subfamily